MIHTSRFLGYTRSKKKICAYPLHEVEFIELQTSRFTLPDYFDAFGVFEYLSLIALRRSGEGADEFEEMVFMRRFHRNKITPSCLEEEKERLDIVTSLQICNHGKNLLLHFLQE